MEDLLIFGGVVFLGSAVLYIIARDNDREARILRSVTRVNLLNDLAQVLDVKRLPLVVTISGKVASENPINCEITGLKGVIVEKRVEKLYLKKKDVAIEQKENCMCAIKQKEKCKCAIKPQKTCNNADSWTLHSKFISCNTEEAHGIWCDDGTDRVHVAGARGATDFVYTAARSKFDESGQTLVCDTLDSLQDKKILGLKRTERILPVGTSLTVVGEASKDDDGPVRIQRPPEGPFYVSCKTIDQLIANSENSARWCKYISVGLTAIGASLIAAYAIESRG